MKKSILLGLICLAVAACDKKEDAAPQPDLKSTVVSYQKPSELKTNGPDLNVQLLEVTDSRCPSNAVCIVAGSADVKFKISDGTNETDVQVVFSSVNKKVSQQEFKLGGQTYNLVVTEVLPYPETSKSPSLEEYKVAVSIEKL